MCVCVLCLCVYIYLKTTQNMHNLFIIKRNRLGLIYNSFRKKNVNFLLILLLEKICIENIYFFFQIYEVYFLIFEA